MIRTLAISLLAVAPAAWGQIGGPVSGWVLDERSGLLRPVVGLPGASYLGEPVGGPFVAAAVHPGRDAFALTVTEGARLALVRGLRGAAETVGGPEHALGAGASLLVELSRDGRTGVVADAATGRIQRISGLPDRPQPGPLWQAEGEIQRLAVLNSGVILAATATSLTAFSDGGARIVSSEAARLLTVSESGEMAIYLHRSRVYKLMNDGGSPVPVADLEAGAESLAMLGKPGAETLVVLAGGRLTLLDGNDGTLRADFPANGLQEIAMRQIPGEQMAIAGRVAAESPRLFLIDLSAGALARARETGGSPIFFVPVNQ